MPTQKDEQRQRKKLRQADNEEEKKCSDHKWHTYEFLHENSHNCVGFSLIRCVLSCIGTIALTQIRSGPALAVLAREKKRMVLA